MSFFKSLKTLTKYNEPKDIDGFELLESENEGTDIENPHKIPASKSTQEKLDGNINTAMRKMRTKNKSSNDIISKDLNENINRIKQELLVPKNQDIVFRRFKIGRQIEAYLVFVEGMVDKNIINDFVLKELMNPSFFNDLKDICPITYIEECVLSINQVTKMNEIDKIIGQILNGLSALFIQDCDECLLIESRGYEKRNVEKPVTENVIRGSHEGFTENLRTNLTLLRKIIKNKNLVTEILPLGITSNNNCAILYLDGIANPSIINEVKKRINKINMDYVSSTGTLEEILADNQYIMVPFFITTERPDRAASFLMDGKVVICINGSPFVISVPGTFFEAMQSPEDFFLKWEYASALRIIKLLGLFVALFLPGLYIALTLFHQEMIPTELLISIAQTRENVPFPTIVEIIMMEVSFELIREAGIRVPGAIGTTLGIIGALILGQAAVSAQIVSPILIIIVAVTGIGSFAIPAYALSFSIRILRFVFIILGALAGFYGISFGILIMIGLACSVKSFGVPYFSPIAPKTKHNPDIIISAPIPHHKNRPDYANTLNRKRSGN